MSKNVLLINPKLPQSVANLNIPVSLLYLGTWLRLKGYRVNVLDVHAYYLGWSSPDLVS